VDLPAMSSRIGSIQGDIIQAADTTPFTDIPGFLKGGKCPCEYPVLRIRDPVHFLTPGWVKIRIQMGDEQPGSYFRKLKNNILG
jgi:hypothetical protein